MKTDVKDTKHSRTRSKDRARRSSDRDNDKNKRTTSQDKRARSRSGSARRKRRERSPTPRPTKIHIARLTRNTTREHISEIFSVYGELKSVDMPFDRFHQHLTKCFAYIEYNNADDAENAMKHMDGGQIDGQEIQASPVPLQRPRNMMMNRRSPMPMRNMYNNNRNNNRGPNRNWNRSPMRFNNNNNNNRRSPIRRRQRTRSPIRRRRHSNSSDSSR